MQAGSKTLQRFMSDVQYERPVLTRCSNYILVSVVFIFAAVCDSENNFTGNANEDGHSETDALMVINEKKVEKGDADVPVLRQL